jgi:hypothetical protein
MQLLCRYYNFSCGRFRESLLVQAEENRKRKDAEKDRQRQVTRVHLEQLHRILWAFELRAFEMSSARYRATELCFVSA